MSIKLRWQATSIVPYYFKKKYLILANFRFNLKLFLHYFCVL